MPPRGTSWLQKVCNNTKIYTIMYKSTSLRPKITSKVRCNVQKYIKTLKSRNTSWGQEIWKHVAYDVKRFVMTSNTSQKFSWSPKYVMMPKSLSWSQKVRCDVKNTSWRQTVRHVSKIIKVRIQKHIMTSTSSSWRQQVRHGVKNMVMMTKGSQLLKKVRHNVKKTSQCQNVYHKIKNTSKVCHEVKTRHDVKKFVMISKTCNDVKKFVITSTSCFHYILITK